MLVRDCEKKGTACPKWQARYLETRDRLLL
jgi:hypothetical protein